MKEKILCVDDEPHVLEGYQRALRKEFDIEIAVGGADALAAVAERGPYVVIVSDMRMPNMDGVQFLARVKELAPESIRMMLTGNADQQTATDAVNEGSIYRFLTKPCPTEALARALTAGIEQYRLKRLEKELLEQTVRGCIEVLTDILSLVNPTAFSRAARARRLVEQLTAALKVTDAWQVEVAAMLSHVGCVTIPEGTLIKVYEGMHLHADELRMLQHHPQVGGDFVRRIPRLETVAEIIRYQEKRFNGSGLPDDERRGKEVPLGSRILKVALDFDRLTEAKLTNVEAFEEISRRDGWYDPEVVAALEQILACEDDYEDRCVLVSELLPGMTLAEDIVTPAGLLLTTKGQQVTRSLCLRLQNYIGGIPEHIKVKVQSDKAVSMDAPPALIPFEGINPISN